MQVVDLTSNICVDQKFSGELEIQGMISSIESKCENKRPSSQTNEVLCEQTLKCEYGICCIIGRETHINSQNSQNYSIFSSDFTRIQSLSILEFYEVERLENIQFFPVVNRLIRNLIRYEVKNTLIKNISEENFNGMIWLEILRLSSNLIETVPDDAFQNLISLKEIDLSKNEFFFS